MAPQEAVRPLVSWCGALGPCEFGCLVVTGKRAGSVTIVGSGSISVIGSGSISVIGTSVGSRSGSVSIIGSGSVSVV